MTPFDQLLSGARHHLLKTGRPQVTLAYAQSLDGSIAARGGQPVKISGAESMRMTHLLRSRHAAIAVGIGTILADDPRLTVRLVEGPQPQPVVLDSQLRLPLSARVWEHPRKVWVASSSPANRSRAEMLVDQGARVLPLPTDTSGRLSLEALLDCLGESGIDSLMVEGGATIITSFLEQRLANYLVLTMAPYLLGGLGAVEKPLAQDKSDLAAFPTLTDPASEWLGRDLVVWGKLT